MPSRTLASPVRVMVIAALSVGMAPFARVSTAMISKDKRDPVGLVVNGKDLDIALDLRLFSKNKMEKTQCENGHS